MIASSEFPHALPVPPPTSGVVDLSGDPIAIVGAACRLPGARDLRELWSLLSEGREAVRPLPENRFPLRDYWHPRRGEPGKFYATRAGTLDDVETFDAAFFGISAREARQMDPQQRLLLELAWEALEDAGAVPSDLTAAGVYVGASGPEYANMRLGDPASTDAYFMPGNTLSIFSNRISYLLNLHGPSMTVDTACSSSLFALHLACEDLRHGRAPAALVGGVNLLLSPYPFIGFCSAGMLSPTGHCHAFDAAADGYVRAEGGVMLLLKPLSTARRDGDAIHAVLMGTGINSDGRTHGMAFPGLASQTALLRTLYGQAGIDPRQLAFIEAHGTGTAAGDPVETAALGTVLGRGRSSPLPIGSIKTNIGHLEPASGLASVLKAMLAFRYRQLPASLHYRTPNPNIDFGTLNLAVASAPVGLGSGQLVAGVNNFGFGGANAHVILATAPADSRPETLPTDKRRSDDRPPILLSARSEGALRALAAQWAATSWDDSAVRGLARRRVHHPHRVGILPSDDATMREALLACAQGQPHAAAVEGRAISDARTVFVFSGNGSQFPGMGQDLLECSIDFQDGVTAADTALTPYLGWSVLAAMRTADWSLERAESAQPMLFAFQVGLLQALRRQGVQADTVIGHSVGEIAAAYCAGAVDLAEAARIVVLRSRHQEIAAGGGMAVLNCSADDAAALIADIGVHMAIAAINAPHSVTLAGDDSALRAVEAAASDRSLVFQRLAIGYAFHSPEMDPIERPLLEALGSIKSVMPAREIISTVTGDTITAALDGTYWWRNVRQPVLFATAVRHLAERGNCIFVEIGPRPVLQHYLREIVRGCETQARILPTVRKRSPADPFPRIGLACHAAGTDIQSAPHFAGPARVRDLPGTQWQKERHWYEPTDSAVLTLWNQQDGHPLLGTRGQTQPNEWVAHLDTTIHPWLADHVVGDTAVLAAACMIEFAFAAGRIALPAASLLELQDFHILRPVVLDAAQLREIRVRLDSSNLVTIDSRPRLAHAAWVHHASGRLTAAPAEPTTFPPAAITGSLAGDILYAQAAAAGLNYGPSFRRVERITLGGPRSAEARLTEGTVIPGLTIDPAALDGTFQTLIALAIGQVDPTEGGAPLPQRFGRIRLDLDADAPAVGQVHTVTSGPRETKANIALLDATGRPILSAESCWFARMPGESPLPVSERSFHEHWVHAPLIQASWPDSRFLAMRPVLMGQPAGSDADQDAALLAWAFLRSSGVEALRRAGPAPESNSALIQTIRSLLQDAEDEVDFASLPDSTSIWQTLFLDPGDWLASSLLLAWMGDRIGQAFASSDESANELQAIPAAPLKQLLAGRSAVLAARLLGDAILAFAEDWPRDRPLRILEIHSDRGVLARHLMPRLTAVCPGVTYTVLEGDDKRLAHLRTSLLTRLPGISIVQDTAPRSHDLVVTFACGLRGIGPATVLDSMNALVPGGVLLAVETAATPTWAILQALSPGEVAGIEAWRGLPHRLRAAVEGQPTRSPFPIALLAACPAEEEVVAGNGNPDPEDDGRTIASRIAPRIVMAPPAAVPDETGQVAHALLTLAAEARRAAADGTALVVVTRGEDTDPVEAARAAFARVIANEYPALACRRIELSPDLSDPEAESCLDAELGATDGESELRWTAEGRFVRRLREGVPAFRTVSSATLCLRQPVPGPLNRLRWTKTRSEPPGPHDVAIRVMASGLNYRDVLSAIGMLPEELLLDGFAGATLGMECAGIVEAVGDAVEGVSVGDRVMALAASAHATHVVTDARSVLPLPPALSFAAGATIPVAFLTVIYALETVGSLRPGETVLIHGAAGGVGLAAVQYAAHVGARVIATAGSPAKRAALRRLGIEMVLDSRSLRFSAEIEAATGGEGVDVVLNALSGDAMERSLALLRPFGRFLELGKRDFLANTRVGLGPLRRNVSYHAIDVDALVRHRPALVRTLMQTLHDLVAQGALAPLPHTCFPFGEADEAFALMRTSAHVGKIVLTTDDVTVPPRMVVPTDRTVLISGGTTGFGGQMARWLVSAGARHIVLISRRGTGTPEAEVLRNVLLQGGAKTVDIRACDVGDVGQLSTLLADVRATLPPIGAVVHAATVVADGLITSITPQHIQDSLHAKLGGALALDSLTREDPISLFLVFSSATITLGAPGQGAYVAANAAVEALVRRRRAEGLPGCAVRWGPIADAGLLERNATAREALSRRLGARAMRARLALDALPDLLASGEPTPVLAELDWQATSGTLPIMAEPLFAAVARRPHGDGETTDLRAMLAGLDETERQGVIVDLILDELTRIMQTERAALPLDQPLTDLGMDSLTAVELALGLERRLAVTLPGFAWQEMTVQRVARQVAGLIQGAPAAAATDAMADRHLSETQIEALAAATDRRPEPPAMAPSSQATLLQTEVAR
ncbi:type I polyketide synthase [Gluconacetobacter tumulisoli]|uniref:SDR family NAD(P)-dependent oxidoreductase n=1 Tax=Gluconacetobacter tumulisoli TaxID=1286189 RepID=A0A7W4PLZ5_9PROT|nr:type I polyketide synthase [Gluconacetobacter tumulisoli]MBB2201129.1 SDR family NAD(P)-dependent oxidoreductase [Gluconacetobacter tumulisoli]